MRYWRKEGGGGGLSQAVLTVLTIVTLLTTVFADEHDHVVSAYF